MKKIFNWLLAAILICGATVFTSCSSDTSDKPAQTGKKLHHHRPGQLQHHVHQH